MQFSTLAIDLDGTLLVGEDLPEENRMAVAAASAAGMHIVIATARWRQMAQRVMGKIGIEAPIIACNGAEVFLPDTGLDIYDERLPPDFVSALFAICNGHRCIATVSMSDQTLLKLDGEPAKSLMTPEMRWVRELVADAQAQPPRIVTVQGTAVIDLIRGQLAESARETVNITNSIGPSGKIILTITAKLADKGEALKAACRHLGVDPRQVIAFGDADNDMPMFRVAGASVAMGNAADSLKAAATAVTLANTECGVAKTINRLLDTGAL